MAAATAWTGLLVMTSRPPTYRTVVDGEAWPSAVATLRTSAPASTALAAKVCRRVWVQPGDACVVTDPADESVRRSRVHRDAGAGGEQRSGLVAAAAQPVVDRNDGGSGEDGGARFGTFASDPQHGGSSVGVEVSDLQAGLR